MLKAPRTVAVATAGPSGWSKGFTSSFAPRRPAQAAAANAKNRAVLRVTDPSCGTGNCLIRNNNMPTVAVLATVALLLMRSGTAAQRRFEPDSIVYDASGAGHGSVAGVP